MPRWAEVARSRPVRVALLLVVAAFVAWGAVALWEPVRALAVEITDEWGLKDVERHRETIVAAGRESRVDPPLIAGVMFMESRGRGGQTSHADAHGLMQLVPAAASDAARRLGLPEPTVEELLEDGELNVRLGAAHLAWLLEHRGDWSLEQVLVAYNAGRVKLLRWIERHGSYAAWRTSELAGDQPTGALRYALGVLSARERFLERGRIRPLPGVPWE